MAPPPKRHERLPAVRRRRYHSCAGTVGADSNLAATPALNRGAADMSAYAASKAAVLNLTQSLA